MAATQPTENAQLALPDIQDPLLSSLIEHIDHPVIIVDEDPKPLKMNASATNFLRATADPLCTRSLDHLLGSVSMATKIRRAIISGKPAVFEDVSLKSASGALPLQRTLKVTPVGSAASRRHALIFIVNDTGPKDALSQRDEMHAGLKVARDSARSGLWEWEPVTGRYRELGLWRAGLGYDLEQAFTTYDAILDRVHVEDRDRLQRAFGNVAGGTLDEFELTLRHRCKNGHYRWIICQGKTTERSRSGETVLVAGTYVDITELKNTQDALHESTSRLNFALESGRQGIWEWHPRTGTFSQSGCLRYFGDSELEVPIKSGQQLIELTHPEDRKKTQSALSSYLRGDTPIYSVEQRVRMWDGNYRTFLARGQAMERDDNGFITRMVGTHTDISDLKVHAQRLELALENGHQGMCEWRPVTDTVEFSDSWYALFGYDKGEINNIRHDVSGLVHPDDIKSLRPALINLLNGQDDDYVVQYRFKRKNGEYLWVMERSIVLERDVCGRATFVVGTYVDIDRQKAVEHELRESRHFLNMVLDTIPDHVYWKDTQSRYLGANRHCLISAGMSDVSEIAGRTDHELPRRKNAREYQENDREIMRTGKPSLHMEHGFVDANGTPRLFETNKAPLRDGSGTTIGVLGLSHEVTEQRRREKQLEKLAESITGSSAGRLLDGLAQGAVELADVASAFVATLDKDGCVATVVSTFPEDEALNGYSYDIKDTPCANAVEQDTCVYPDNVQSVFPTDRSLVDMGIVSYAGKRLLDQYGQAIGIFALLGTEPLQDPAHAQSVLDIVAVSASTELQREQREMALAQSEERYRKTYNNIPVMICTVDVADQITDVNNAWTQVTGFSAVESIETTLADYFSQDSQDLYLTLSQGNFDPRGVTDVTLDFICKDGLVIKLTYSAARTVSSEGVPVTITVLEDVTNQLLAEEQLRLAATAFETHEGLVIRDANRRILRVNTAFKNITGYDDCDVIGKSPANFKFGTAGIPEETEIWKSVNETGKWDGERMNYRADGSMFSAWQTITAVRDDSGDVTHYVENFTDVSELKEALADAERLALYDPLTELSNRRYLMEQLESSISLSRRHGATSALLFIDLDQFKNINDSLGHVVGDALLVQVAKRLTRLMRQEDTIARLGGDEFVVVLPELGKDAARCVDQARRVADKIHIELGKTYEVENHKLNITPTIGVTLFPEEGKTVEAILQEADSAMYSGKADGRNVTKFFHPRMQSAVQMRLSLERDLRTAADRGELSLNFQPQYDVNGEVFAAEGLLRWNHLARGFVSPGIFIPIAEESGLILEIGHWVFMQALDCLRRWERKNTLFFNHLAVNVSSRQFRSSSFVQEITRGLVSAGVPPERIVIEVTEGTLIENFEETARKMEELRNIGIRFSIDDFGVGYSSLSYLSRLPLDQLKIDRSFVANVINDPNDAVIAETIIGMGRNLKLQTIAEGVETEAQLNFLRDHGCDGFQGFLFSKPVPEADFLALERRWDEPVAERTPDSRKDAK